MKYGSSKYGTIKYGIYQVIQKLTSMFSKRSKARLIVNDDVYIAQNVTINKKITRVRANGYVAVCIQFDGYVKKVRVRANTSNMYYQTMTIEGR